MSYLVTTRRIDGTDAPRAYRYVATLEEARAIALRGNCKPFCPFLFEVNADDRRWLDNRPDIFA